MRKSAGLYRNIKAYSKTKRVPVSMANFPAKGYLVQEPYGVTLVMSPWNYPFMLAMEPLAGAIAAGNCCVVKPSAYAPATSAVIAAIVKECFPEGYVAVIEGGRQENEELLEQRFDYIFFTGSVSVGKLVMEKAAKHLTPGFPGAGGQKPVHRRPYGEAVAGGKTDCIWKIFKLRADVCCTGLCAGGAPGEGRIFKISDLLDEKNVQ